MIHSDHKTKNKKPARPGRLNVKITSTEAGRVGASSDEGPIYPKKVANLDEIYESRKWFGSIEDDIWNGGLKRGMYCHSQAVEGRVQAASPIIPHTTSCE
jgi:hypothetical protein